VESDCGQLHRSQCAWNWPWINQLVRTGDGAKVLVVDYGSDLNMAVYDAASNTFMATASRP